MNAVALALASFFLLGYLILGGADIGVGMMSPLIARTDRRRRLIIATVAPFFLANEVWLVATAGLLAGAFPALEASLVHGLYPVTAPLLVAWVARDMSLWLRGRVESRGWRGLWDVVLTGASLILAFSWGLLLTTLLSGSTEHVRTDPATLLGALLITVLFGVHGWTFATIRLGARRRIPRFLVTSAVIATIAVAAGSRIGPSAYLADVSTLKFLLLPVVAVVPLLVATQAWVWWVFRHRVTEPSYL
jgi:cytochrome d ubiquinol oxidase subunit II